MCPQRLGEIREVLTTRPRLRKWISLETATLFVDTIEALVDLVDDPAEVQTATRDANDDYLIALAREKNVELIVSGDKDLLDWKQQRPPVVTPAQFEQRSDDHTERRHDAAQRREPPTRVRPKQRTRKSRDRAGGQWRRSRYVIGV